MSGDAPIRRSESASLSAAFDPELVTAVIHAYRAVDPLNLARRWLLLEVAHVVGQTRFLPHTRVHLLMLALSWHTRNGKEIAGQLFRLCLVPLGHLIGRLPLGNPGSARVGAFEPLPISPEIRAVLAEMQKKQRGRVRSNPHR